MIWGYPHDLGHTHILSPHFPPLHRPHLLQPLQALRPVFEGAIQAADLRMGGIHAAVVLLDVVNPGTCGETCEEKIELFPQVKKDVGKTMLTRQNHDRLKLPFQPFG